jgi:hypothetical protein
MQEIEIRRSLQAEEVVSFQANPAIVPGVNGEPDRVVIALEITAGVESIAEPGSQIATRWVFSIEIDAGTGFATTFAHAYAAAERLAAEVS